MSVWQVLYEMGLLCQTQSEEKELFKHPLTQKLLESLQEQIEKATAAFMLQDSIVLILGQLYQIIYLLETHVRRKICWKAAKGSAQNQSE